MKNFLKNALTATLTAAAGGAAGIGYSTYEYEQERNAREAAVQKVSDDLTEERGHVTQLVKDLATEREARTGLGQELAQSREVAVGLESMLNELQSELNLRDGEVEELRVALQSLDHEVNPQRLIDAIRKVRSSLVRVGPGDATSSGFFISNCDYIVTSAHVTEAEREGHTDKEGAVLITLNTNNRTEEPITFYADLVRLNGKEGLKGAESSFGGGSDIAILRVPPNVKKNLPDWVRPVEFRDISQEPLRDGEGVFLAGHPFIMANSIAVGRVSNSERHFDMRRYQEGHAPDPLYPVVQVDAQMNPGNSGGISADFNGRLIGISFFGFGHGSGVHHARHVLNLKAYLAECGICDTVSGGEKEILKRWHAEWDVLQEREHIAQEAAKKAKEKAPEKVEPQESIIEIEVLPPPVPPAQNSEDGKNDAVPSLTQRFLQFLRSLSSQRER